MLRRRPYQPDVQLVPPTTFDEIPDIDELVIEPKTGRVRQAGTHESGQFILKLKEAAEQDLYVFDKAILRRHLTPNLSSPKLHGWFCRWLQRVPPYRKMALLPRGHLKSAIVGEALPMHMLIQPDPSDGENCYWPKLSGADMRILLIGEKQDLMSAHLRWIETQFETNELLRAFWPHRVWDNPRREAKKWNELEMEVPRRGHFPDPSIAAVGVGGAMTGKHPNVLIKDDIIALEAANSLSVMEAAWETHKTSRPLLAPNEDRGLEYIIGTHWAVGDIYFRIQQTDPSVEYIVRSIIEDGTPIWEHITLSEIDRLRKEYGPLFHLLYMNSAADPELTDFHPEMLRFYKIDGGVLAFDEDERDVVLADRESPAPARPAPEGLRGTVLTPEIFKNLMENNPDYMRWSSR